MKPIPIEPMLVAETKNTDSRFKEILKNHKGKTFAEVKYDGYRIQVHKNSGLWLFTRNLNPLSPELFPDIDFSKLEDGIYDGELVGYGNSLEGFNAVKKRVRDSLDKKLVEQFPLQIRYFDVLKFKDKEIMNLPLEKRRQILEDYVQNISEQESFSNPELLKLKFQETADLGLEGLVCKNPLSLYVPGARTKDWVKVKNFITLDFTILGIYNGEGKASALPFAAVLLGTKNNGKYETISKVGISNREIIDKIYQKIRHNLTETIPENTFLSPAIEKKTYARKVPASYIQGDDSCVVEAEFLNITRSKNWHSCGLENGYAYSLRIPSIKRFREDKQPEDCSTTSQVEELYTN